jgi:hypothetical protein
MPHGTDSMLNDHQNMSSPTVTQHGRGDSYMTSRYGVAGPQTFEEAVDQEIARGCTPEVAAVRVINAYGSSLPRTTIAKGEEALHCLGEVATDMLARPTSSFA